MYLIIFTTVILACEAANFNRGYLPPQGSNSNFNYEGSSISNQEIIIKHEHKENDKNVEIGSTKSGTNENINSQNNSSVKDFDSDNFDAFYPNYSRVLPKNQNSSPSRIKSEHETETFSYNFETENGIRAEENGTAENGVGVKARGSFSYLGDNGKMYRIAYTADENGYRPFGDHLPTSPPIPEAILRSIERNAEDEAAGIFDDGKYHPEEYESGRYIKDSDEDNYNTASDYIQHKTHIPETKYSDNILKTSEYLPKFRLIDDQDYLKNPDISDINNNKHRSNTVEDETGGLKFLTNLQDETIDSKKEQASTQENYAAVTHSFNAETPSHNNIDITRSLPKDLFETPSNNLQDKNPNIQKKSFISDKTFKDSHNHQQIIELPNEEIQLNQGEDTKKAVFEKKYDSVFSERPLHSSTLELEESRKKQLKFEVAERDISQEPIPDDGHQEKYVNKYVDGQVEFSEIEKKLPQNVTLPELKSFSPELDQNVISLDISNKKNDSDNQPQEDIKKDAIIGFIAKLKPESRVLNIPEYFTSSIIPLIKKVDNITGNSLMSENSERRKSDIAENEESVGFRGVAEVIDYTDDEIVDQSETNKDKNTTKIENVHPDIQYGPSFEIRTALKVTGELKQYKLSEIDDLEAKRREYCKLRCKAQLDSIRKKLTDGNTANNTKANLDISQNGDIQLSNVPTKQKLNINNIPNIYHNVPQNSAIELQIGDNMSLNSDDVTQFNGDNDEQVKNVTKTIEIPVEVFNLSMNQSYNSQNVPNTLETNLSQQNNEYQLNELKSKEIYQYNNDSQQFNDHLSENKLDIDHDTENILNTPKHNLEISKNTANISNTDILYSQEIIPNAVTYTNSKVKSQNNENKSQNIVDVPREIESSEQQYAQGKSLREQSVTMEVIDQESFLRSLFDRESLSDETLLSNDSINDGLGKDLYQTRRPSYYEPDTGYHY